MFRSNSCAVLTSFETTNALTGCCACPPIASANWFVPDAPTMLNAGGIDGVAALPPPVAVGVVGAVVVPTLVLFIALMFARPAAAALAGVVGTAATAVWSDGSGCGSGGLRPA